MDTNQDGTPVDTSGIDTDLWVITSAIILGLIITLIILRSHTP